MNKINLHTKKMFPRLNLRRRVSIALTVLIVTGSISVLAWAIITGRVTFRAATGQIFSLSPASLTVDKDQIFPVVVQVSTNTLNTVVGTVNVTYNSNDLAVVGFSPAGDSFAGADTVFDYVVKEENNPGSLRITRGQPGDKNAADSDDGFTGTNGKFITVNFKAIRNSTAALTTAIGINQNNSSLIADDGVGTAELDAVSGTTITINPSSTPSVSLTVNLTANPSNGVAPLNDVDLMADVGGTATGSIRYRFDCTNDGTYDVDTTSSLDPYTAANACDYAASGLFTARVLVDRGGVTAQHTTTITVSSPPPPPPPPPPPDAPQVTCSITAGTNQLTGCLWDGINFNTSDGSAPAGTALASPVPLSATALDLNWGQAGPNTTVGSDTFSASWRGSFVFAPGTYTFYAGSDDGMRIHFNGVTRINRWIDRSFTQDSFTQTFTAQTTVPIEVDFYENGGDARVLFRWSGTAPTSSPAVTPPPAATTTTTCAPSRNPGDYHYVWVSQNGFPTIDRGQSYRFEVTVRNTGQATWCRGTVNLGTDRGRDRIPGFIRGGPAGTGSGWLLPNRVHLVESSVAPGATGTYQFYYTVSPDKSFGTFREYFRLVADGVTWMEDYGIYWDISVPSLADAYKARYVSQNGYPTLRRGQSYQFEVKLLNTGTAVWQRGTVNLGTDRPRDVVWYFLRQSPDGAPSGWLNQNRVFLVENSVAPGAIGTFRFWYTVPQDKRFATYRDYYRPVADGISWMDDWGIYWDVTVVP